MLILADASPSWIVSLREGFDTHPVGLSPINHASTVMYARGSKMHTRDKVADSETRSRQFQLRNAELQAAVSPKHCQPARDQMKKVGWIPSRESRHATHCHWNLKGSTTRVPRESFIFVVKKLALQDMHNYKQVSAAPAGQVFR
jgi:hypothetical protein